MGEIIAWCAGQCGSGWSEEPDTAYCEGCVNEMKQRAEAAELEVSRLRDDLEAVRIFLVEAARLRRGMDYSDCLIMAEDISTSLNRS